MTLHACIVVMRDDAHLSGTVPPVYGVSSYSIVMVCREIFESVSRQTIRFGNPLSIVSFSPSASAFEPHTANSLLFIHFQVRTTAASHLS